jgi:hypothetical protein
MNGLHLTLALNCSSYWVYLFLSLGGVTIASTHHSESHLLKGGTGAISILRGGLRIRLSIDSFHQNKSVSAALDKPNEILFVPQT